MFTIRINIGTENKTVVFYFVHKDKFKLSEQEQVQAFDKAVKELDHIYSDYGRFATETGVIKLFGSFGFERTKP